MSDLNGDFSLRIRELMSQKRFKGVEIAQAAGMKPQQFSDTLATEDPRISTLSRISSALGVPLYYLFMSPEQRAVWDSKASGRSSGMGLSELLGSLSVSELEGLLSLKRTLESSRKKSS